MDKRNIVIIAILFSNLAFGQDIFKNWSMDQNIAHLQFLASDELQGRDTGEPGNDIAARYIAVQLQSYGVMKLPGMESYFQKVHLAKVKPQEHTVEWNEKEYDQGKEFLALSQSEYVGNFETNFINHGISDDDYKDADVEGKIVITLMGDGEDKSPQGAFGLRKAKIELAKKHGAMGVVEIFSIQAPWNMMVNFMNRSRLDLDLSAGEDAERFFYGLINLEKEAIGEMTKGNAGRIFINYPGQLKTSVVSNNVLGYIEGTDPALKDDYILLSAHFDHVGTGKRGENPDTIFNGARDNGLGTVALLAAAKTLAAHPPKRSVIIAAWTGEEKGLLGSKYFVEKPPVELNKIRFNLNSDGAGYDDTSAVSVLGLHRVGAEKEMVAASKKFGLKVIADPAPEQGLFDRSDNVNFAKVGIPAPTFSPGTTGFTKEIGKYYHQPGDHFDSVDQNYVDKFYKAFTLAGYLIANKTENPMWVEGDKYEEAGKTLYGLE